MASLLQAFIWMGQGKKVRTTRNKKGYYRYLDVEGFIDSEGDRSYNYWTWPVDQEWEIYKEPEQEMQQDADYIVWDKEGHRTFAYYMDGEFYDLNTVGAFPLKVDKWAKIPSYPDKP